MNILEAHKRLTAHLEKKGVAAPRITSEILLSHALGIPRIQIYAQHERSATDADLAALRELSRRIAAGEPLQLVVGNASFFGRLFKVKPGVFIPRPETETLVEVVVDSLRGRLPAAPGLLIADIGTGTGVVAITLLLELQTTAAIATDVNPDAVALALENAATLGVSDRITALQGRFFDPVPPENRFACVVSNPPYIRRDDIPTLDPIVRDHDPAAALDGGPDGLDPAREIAKQAAGRLQSGGLLAMEVGIGQSAQTREIFEENGYAEIEVKHDLQGIERVVTGWKK